MSAFNTGTNGGFTIGVRYFMGGNTDGVYEDFIRILASSGAYIKISTIIGAKMQIEYKNPDGTDAINHSGYYLNWSGDNFIVRVSGTTMTIYYGEASATVTLTVAPQNLSVTELTLRRSIFQQFIGYQALFVYPHALSDAEIATFKTALTNGSGYPSGEFFGVGSLSSALQANGAPATENTHRVASWGGFQAVSGSYPLMWDGWMRCTTGTTESMTATSFGGGGGGGSGGGSGASAAIESSTLATYISGSASTSVALATEVRTAIKNLSGAAQATAKADYIAAMRTKEPSLKIAVPQTEFIAYIGTFSSVPPAIEAAPKPIDVILPSESNIVDISTASVDETKYTAIEMPLNTAMTVQDNGVTVGTLTYDGSTYTDGNGATYSVGNSIIFGTKKVTILGQGSALVQITNTYVPVEVNLNVQIDANGTLNILGSQFTAPANIVVASTLLPVDCLYDEAAELGLIEFWEPDNFNDIEAQLATTQKDSNNVDAYRVTAKKLALGLQNVLMGELDASAADPFNASKYASNAAGNRVMVGFGRLALMSYAHYIMGHVQATAAITNDRDFIRAMLSLKDSVNITSAAPTFVASDYKYEVGGAEAIGNYDASAAPWNISGSTSNANLAARLVAKLITNNPSSSKISDNVATSVANIVKQVIGQDASRATDEDNSKYNPENHGLLRFYPNDVIYVSIQLMSPEVTVGSGQQVSDTTLTQLYSNATGDKVYALKITLGPASV
jgi:hypothetical protein